MTKVVILVLVVIFVIRTVANWAAARRRMRAKNEMRRPAQPTGAPATKTPGWSGSTPHRSMNGPVHAVDPKAGPRRGPLAQIWPQPEPSPWSESTPRPPVQSPVTPMPKPPVEPAPAPASLDRQSADDDTLPGTISLADALDSDTTDLTTSRGSSSAPTQPQAVAVPPALQRQVLDLMHAGFEAGAVHLLCDELDIGILDAQRTARTLAGLPAV